MNLPQETTPEAHAPSSRVVGFDLARGFAFMGMVIVNYKVVMGWAANEPEWLGDFFGHFTGRAAPLFVLIAGIGVTLLYRSGMRRWEATDPELRRRRTAAGFFRNSAFLVFMAGLVVVIGYNVHRDGAKGRELDFGRFLEAVCSQDTEKLGKLGDRIGAYREVVWDESSRLFLVCGGLLAALAVAWIVWGRSGHPRWVLARRALFVLGLGYAWYPLWTGDILHFYGVYVGLGALLVGAPLWLLCGAIVVALGATIYLQTTIAFRLGWGPLLEYAEIWDPGGALRNMFFNGWHPVCPWIVFFLVGLILGRIDFARRRSHVALLLIGIALWYGAKVGSPAAQTWLRDAGDRAVIEAFEIEPLAPVNALVLGESLEQPVSKPGLFGLRARGPRVRSEVSQDIDRTQHADHVKATTTVRRLLRAVRGLPYERWRLALEPGETGSPPTLTLRVDYGEKAAAPPEHEQHRRRLISTVVERIQPGLEGETRRAWPAAVDALTIERTLTVRGEGDALVNEAVDRVVLDVAKAKDLSLLLIRMSGLTGTSSWRPGPFYATSATGTSLIVVALCLLIASVGCLRRLTWPVVAAGQMALTLYLAHVLFGLEVLGALGKKSGQTLPFIAFGVVICWVTSLAFATAWRAWFKRGPLELLMRALTG